MESIEELKKYSAAQPLKRIIKKKLWDACLKRS